MFDFQTCSYSLGTYFAHHSTAHVETAIDVRDAVEGRRQHVGVVGRLVWAMPLPKKTKAGMMFRFILASGTGNSSFNAPVEVWGDGRADAACAFLNGCLKKVLFFNTMSLMRQKEGLVLDDHFTVALVRNPDWWVADASLVFTKIDDLKDAALHESVNISGVVLDAARSSWASTNKEFKRYLMCDAEGKAVTLMLWGSVASSSYFQRGAAIEAVQVQVRKYKQKVQLNAEDTDGSLVRETGRSAVPSVIEEL